MQISIIFHWLVDFSEMIELVNVQRMKETKEDIRVKGKKLLIQELYKYLYVSLASQACPYLRKTVLSPLCCSRREGLEAGRVRPLLFPGSLDLCAS